MNDCSYQNADGYFRLRAAAIIIEEGHDLMAKNPKDPYYYAVGGGIYLNESAKDARLKCHEAALYSLMKPKGKITLPKGMGISQTGEREQAFWLPLNSLDGKHPFPPFFKDKLLKMGDTIEHIVTHE
ncbi:MAG: NUDIX hydrolase [Christensenellales bacterium]